MTIESIDTNILLRLVLNDVPEQCRKVQALIQEKSRSFRIADPALTELVFVLEKIYQLDRNEIAELMDIISSIPQFIFDRPLFEATTQLYLDKPALSIVDCLRCNGRRTRGRPALDVRQETSPSMPECSGTPLKRTTGREARRRAGIRKCPKPAHRNLDPHAGHRRP